MYLDVKMCEQFILIYIFFILKCVHQERTWSKLLMSDPFELPEAVVILEIPGKKNPGFDLNNVDQHELIMDESLEQVYTTIEYNMKERFAEKHYSFMRNLMTQEEFVRKKI